MKQSSLMSFVKRSREENEEDRDNSDVGEKKRYLSENQHSVDYTSSKTSDDAEVRHYIA